MLDSIECFRDLRVSEISGLLVVVICLPRGREREGIVFGGVVLVCWGDAGRSAFCLEGNRN
jgi:hypothetical protein